VKLIFVLFHKKVPSVAVGTFGVAPDSVDSAFATTTRVSLASRAPPEPYSVSSSRSYINDQSTWAIVID
jgi:hypothetical protein